MYITKNPAKSRPLSANVLRMMRLSRASPEGKGVVCESRHFTAKDLACCSKQGELFMEAASMGFTIQFNALLSKEEYVLQRVATISSTSGNLFIWKHYGK